MQPLSALPHRAEWYVIVPLFAPVVPHFEMPAPHYLQAPPGSIVVFQKNDGMSRLDAFGKRFAEQQGREYEAHALLTRQAVAQPRVLPIWTDAKAAERFAQRDVAAFLAKHPLAEVPALGVARVWHAQLPILCREAPTRVQPVVGALLDYDGERVDFWGLTEDFDFPGT